MRKFLLLVPLWLWILGSCKEDKIPTYRLATDLTEKTSTTTTVGSAQKSLGVQPRPGTVVWKVPEAWKQEQAGQFVTAAYALPGGGRVTISKLSGDGGGLTANLNRWRGQLGFRPLADNEANGQPLKIVDAEEVMLLFNLTLENATVEADGILAGILPLKTETWYFKFSGPVGVLKKSEGEFADFLRSVRIAGRYASSEHVEPSSN